MRKTRKSIWLHQAFLSSADQVTPSSLRCSQKYGEYRVEISSCNSNIVLHNNIENYSEILIKLKNLEKAAKAAYQAVVEDVKKNKVDELIEKRMIKRRPRQRFLSAEINI